MVEHKKVVVITFFLILLVKRPTMPTKPNDLRANWTQPRL